MNRLIITSGSKYIDIDAYASCFAYKRLLEALGHDVATMSTAVENESISPIIRELGFRFDDVEVSDTDTFSVLDVSHPEMLDDVVVMDRVVEILDHHTGYEDYWKNKSGVNSQIEFIGSICTMIYEKYIEADRLDLLDEAICKLLMAGILDNTLNLKSGVTTDRDIQAYNGLMRIGNISQDWCIEYFQSCYQDIEKDLEQSLINDMKIELVSDYLPEVFGQILVLDKAVVLENMNRVGNVFGKYPEWILNVISLEDGKSYILTSDMGVKEKLEALFEVNGKDNMVVLEKFMLRKEIMKLAREKDSKKK